MLFAFSPPPSPSSSLLSPPPNVSEFVQRRKKKHNNKNERNKKKEDKNKQKNAFFSVTHYFHGRTVDSPWVMGFFCAFFSVSLILSHHHPLHLPLPYTHTHTLSLVLFLFSTFFVFKAGVSVLLAVTLCLDESVFTFLLCVPVRHICLCLFSLYFIGFGVFPRLFLFSFSLFSESSPRL